MHPFLLYRFRYLDPLGPLRCRYGEYEPICGTKARRAPDDPLALSTAHLARGCAP